MLEKLEIIRELTALFEGADVWLMPNSEPELRTYLTQDIAPRFGVNLNDHPAVSQICNLDSDHIYEFLPFLRFLLSRGEFFFFA